MADTTVDVDESTRGAHGTGQDNTNRSTSPPNNVTYSQPENNDNGRGSSTFKVPINLAAKLKESRPLPLWLSAKCSRLITKGNLMALSNRPKLVDPAEWVAHQITENNRSLWTVVDVVLLPNEFNVSICNIKSCPKMSAGRNHQYPWIDQNNEPIDIPACDYMTTMNQWIKSKLDDEDLFPTESATVAWEQYLEIYKTASRSPHRPQWLGENGRFPKHFESISRYIFQQMFRFYAHLYWNHFAEPFYHMDLEKQLNTCFCHFVLTATSLDMIKKDDLAPMQNLLDIWAADGTLPPESKVYQFCDIELGKSLLAMET